MNEDPIVASVRQAREKIARASGYNPKRIAATVLANQTRNIKRLVNRIPGRHVAVV